jgi:hypothetical protein
VKNFRAEASAHSGKDAGDTFMENGILVELKFVDLSEDSPVNAQEFARKKRNKKWIPNNVAEFFFFDEYGFLSISERKIRDCHQEFTQALSQIHGNLKRLYNRLASEALTVDDQ